MNWGEEEWINAWTDGRMSEGVDGRIYGSVVGYMNYSYIGHSFQLLFPVL